MAARVYTQMLTPQVYSFLNTCICHVLTKGTLCTHLVWRPVIKLFAALFWYINTIVVCLEASTDQSPAMTTQIQKLLLGLSGEKHCMLYFGHFDPLLSVWRVTRIAETPQRYRWKSFQISKWWLPSFSYHEVFWGPQSLGGDWGDKS